MKQLIYKTDKCLGCRSCELACAIIHSKNKDLLKVIQDGEFVLPRKKVIASKNKNYSISCRHCKEPKCVDACMAAALSCDKEKGMVLYDSSRCVGCWMCVMVCPYGAIRPDLKSKIPLRCDKCKDELEPACLKACPTQAILWQEEVK